MKSLFRAHVKMNVYTKIIFCLHIKMDKMSNEVELSQQHIENKILTIRGEQVMIDRDLAEMYQVETRVLNQAVSRNNERFPTNFRFQLLKVEYDNLKSQLVTSSWGGVRTLPYAFTEHGVAMLSAVLRSEVAIKVSIQQCSTSHVRFLLIDEKELYHIVEANEMVSICSWTATCLSFRGYPQNGYNRKNRSKTS